MFVRFEPGNKKDLAQFIFMYDVFFGITSLCGGITYVFVRIFFLLSIFFRIALRTPILTYHYQQRSRLGQSPFFWCFHFLASTFTVFRHLGYYPLFTNLDYDIPNHVDFRCLWCFTGVFSCWLYPPLPCFHDRMLDHTVPSKASTKMPRYIFDKLVRYRQI